MRGVHVSKTAALIVAVGLPLVVGACGSDDNRRPVSASTGNAVTSGTAGAGGSATPGPTATSSRPPAAPVRHATEKDYDRTNFSNPTNVTNPWYPLRPGKQLVYEGSSFVDGEKLAHRVVFTVTDLTKVIDGVRNVVAWELDYTDGELVEAELALFAQDDDGNVWHFGQYPEEYDNGKFDKAPAWIHGLRGAKAGIAMRAAPTPRTPDYAQGWGPEVNWTDRARVYRVGLRNCVPAGCYNNVLVIDEYNREDPGAHQLKYYARGVGNIRVGFAGNDPDREVLVLTKVAQLGPAALAKVRQEALKLEKHAYVISKNVYARTPRAQ